MQQSIKMASHMALMDMLEEDEKEAGSFGYDDDALEFEDDSEYDNDCGYYGNNYHAEKPRGLLGMLLENMERTAEEQKRAGRYPPNKLKGTAYEK